jgi:hypothetical protein
MDSTRSILLRLAENANDTRLRWHADLAATRARDEVPARREMYHYQIEADLCLIAAVDAANLPAGFKVYDVTLRPDPLAAAQQLRDLAYGRAADQRIEAEHEAARLAYKAAFAEPITTAEHHLAELLADVPPVRRDKIIERVEHLARHR